MHRPLNVKWPIILIFHTQNMLSTNVNVYIPYLFPLQWPFSKYFSQISEIIISIPIQSA